MKISPTPLRAGFRAKARNRSDTGCDWDCRAAGAGCPPRAACPAGTADSDRSSNPNVRCSRRAAVPTMSAKVRCADSQRVPRGGLQVHHGDPVRNRDVCDGGISDDVDRDARDGESELIGDRLEQIVCPGSRKRDFVDLVVNDIARAIRYRKLHHAAVRPQQNDDCRSVFPIQYFLYCQLLRDRLPVAAGGDRLLAVVTAGEQKNPHERRRQPGAQGYDPHPWRTRCPLAGEKRSCL